MNLVKTICFRGSVSRPSSFHALFVAQSCKRPNYRLQRTVMRHRVRSASASFHYALTARRIRHRAAAEPGVEAVEKVREVAMWFSPTGKVPSRVRYFEIFSAQSKSIALPCTSLCSRK